METAFYFDPRIIRSPLADCWGDELGTSLQAYSSDYLQEIASEGFNGIWLHIQLRETVATNLFPSPGAEKIKLLNRIVEKAAGYGVKVYVYLLEPRAPLADDPVWNKYPEVKGQPFVLRGVHSRFDGTYYALCTSTQAVKEYLVEGSASLFRQVPGLAGAFLINASEGHTHCYSHFCKYRHPLATGLEDSWEKTDFQCSRCVTRDPVEVTAEVINCLYRGIRSSSPTAKVIVWTWSWSIIEPDPQPRLIAALPDDVILMSDWERGGWKKVAGKVFPVDEYSFSSIGPSPRFRQQHRLAKRRGLKTMAKIQIGNTHELVSVPYLPLPFLLAEKFKRMKEIGVSGYLGCWIFGGGISPMSRLAGLMSRKPQPEMKKAVSKVAQFYFGQKASSTVTKAWLYFSRAWRQYPFSIPFLYYGPINYATAYPLSLKDKPGPAISSWLPLERDKDKHLKVYDNLESWLKPFTVGQMTEALRFLLKEWRKGCALLEKASLAEPENKALQLEKGLARHIELSVHSVANIVLFYHLLRDWRQEKNVSRKSALLMRIRKLLQEELKTTEEEIKLVAEDDRLGYHAEAHTHLFTLEDLYYRRDCLKKEIKKIDSWQKEFLMPEKSRD